MTGAISRRLLGGALALGLIIGGCSRKPKAEEQAMPETTTPAAVPAPAPAGPSDAEIADIVVTANTIDVDAAKLAKDKTKNPEVKAFAERMINDHTMSNDSAKALTHRLNVTPADNPTSQSLKSSAEQSTNTLKSESGPAFDKAYLNHEIAYHQQVLEAIDRTLIPSAQNPELKALLEKTRPIIESHLEMAKAMQAKLGT